MKRIALLCLAAAAVAPALATELVSYEGGNTIRLADGACTNETVLARLDPQLHNFFKAASAVVNGRSFSACWSMTPAGAHLIYEDGDQGLVRRDSLKVLLAV